MSIKFLNKKSDANAIVITDGQVGIGGAVPYAAIKLIKELPTIDFSFTNSYSSAFSEFTNLQHAPNINRNSSATPVTSTDLMFNGCERLEDVKLFDTSSVNNTYGMFQDCKKLKTLPNFNFSNAKVVYDMFSGCTSLETLENIIMGAQFTSAQEMFKNCKKLKKLPANLDFSKCSSLSYLFYLCENLEDNLVLDVAACTNLSYAFTGCGKNTNIAITLANTNKVTNWASAFISGTGNISPIPSMEAATSVASMFSGNTNVVTLPISSIGKATSVYCLCYNCTALTAFPEIDTSLVTNFQRMCHNCSALVTVPVLNMVKATSSSSTTQMFEDCPLLSDESLNNIMASLLTATGKTSNKTLKNCGLSETQAQTCTTLSNYEAFTAAGWTTGYDSIDNPTEGA